MLIDRLDMETELERCRMAYAEAGYPGVVLTVMDQHTDDGGQCILVEGAPPEVCWRVARTVWGVRSCFPCWDAGPPRSTDCHKGMCSAVPS